MALTMALMGMLLLLPLTLGLMTLSATEVMVAANHASGAQTFYCAESGTERALFHLQNAQPIPETVTLFDGQCEVTTTGAVLLADADGAPLEVEVISSASGPRNARRIVRVIHFREDATRPWQVRGFREVGG